MLIAPPIAPPTADFTPLPILVINPGCLALKGPSAELPDCCLISSRSSAGGESAFTIAANPSISPRNDVLVIWCVCLRSFMPDILFLIQ